MDPSATHATPKTVFLKSDFGEADPDKMTVTERLEILITKRGLSERTRHQYRSIIGRFEVSGYLNLSTEEGSDNYVNLADGIANWFADELGDLVPASIATYRSALSLYVKATGYPINVSAVLDTSHADRQGRRIKGLDNLELRRLRSQTKDDRILRTAIELAIAGLKPEEIVKVKPRQVDQTSHETSAIWVSGSRHRDVFDEISVDWLRDAAGSYPAENGYSETRTRRQIWKAVRKVKQDGRGISELRVTGVRRAIAKGIRKEKIAESIGVKGPQPSWSDFPTRKSRESRKKGQPPEPMPPIDTGELGKRKPVEETLKMSLAEYDTYLNELVGEE